MNAKEVRKSVEKWHSQGERFLRLVGEATGCPKERLELRHWSLQIHIFQVKCKEGRMYSASGALLELADDTKLKGTIQSFTSKEYTPYCFLDTVFNINDIYELQERVHVIYLDPAYCQNVTLNWSEYHSSFIATVNEGKAYFSVKDLVNPIHAEAEQERFNRWVQKNKHCEEGDKVAPFNSHSLLLENKL